MSPLLGCFAFGLGLCDAFQLLGAGLPHPLIGFPSVLAAFLVDVVGRVGLMPVGPPGGDALIEGVGMALAAALGEVSGSRFRTSAAWL